MQQKMIMNIVMVPTKKPHCDGVQVAGALLNMLQKLSWASISYSLYLSSSKNVL